MPLLDPLIRRLEALGLAADRDALARIRRHSAILMDWNRAARLVSAADACPAGLLRHFMESAEGLPWLASFRKVVDLGSGGGFPGAVWSAFFPSLPVVLVEASRRKAAFLVELRRELRLDALEVVCERVDAPARLEALGGDLLTTRATGQGELLLRAGRLATGRPVRVILYPGRAAARRLAREDATGYVKVAECRLPSARGGSLWVMDRDVPRGT
ncbi:MAG: 16S rRNA (guanine(527)-N(7))-methyltransferase RsmG [Acidobacteriota bacterium]